MAKELPIGFTMDMVKAILDGRKTVTRRVIKESYIYSLTDDWIYGIHTDNNLLKGFHNGNDIKKDTNSTEQRLQGWLRRTNIFTNEIQRLWSEKIRGLVSVKRMLEQTGEKEIFNDNSLSQKQESDKNYPPLNLHGFSWDAIKKIYAGETFRWKPTEQQAGKFVLGNTNGKLDGQKSSRERLRRRKTSDGKTDRQRVRTFEVGVKSWSVQPASCRPCSKNVAGWHISYSSCQKNRVLWVKESYCHGIEWDDCKPSEVDPLCDGNDIWYFADGERPTEGWGKKRSSLFMPKWVARRWLEVISVRPEQLQEITGEDAQKEGWPRHQEIFPSINTNSKAKSWFEHLWDSINAKRGYPWESNPWVWRIEFKEATNG